MTSLTIQAALERLTETHEAWITPEDNIGEEYTRITEELAKLIEAVARPFEQLNRDGTRSAWCPVCRMHWDNPSVQHYDDCALINLCKAITGE